MEIPYLSTTHSSNFGSEETLRSFDGINKNTEVSQVNKYQLACL